MAEKQEIVWVVLRYTNGTAPDYIPGDNWPVKVFDDRKDARVFVNRMNERSRRYTYSYHRCKKG